MNIRENVKFILDKRGMSQVELARRMGVSKQAVQKFLGGNINITTVQKMAVALDTTVETILSETPLSVKDDPIPGRVIATGTKLVCPHCGAEITILAK